MWIESYWIKIIGTEFRSDDFDGGKWKWRIIKAGDNREFTVLNKLSGKIVEELKRSQFIVPRNIIMKFIFVYNLFSFKIKIRPYIFDYSDFFLTVETLDWSCDMNGAL